MGDQTNTNTQELEATNNDSPRGGAGNETPQKNGGTPKAQTPQAGDPQGDNGGGPP